MSMNSARLESFLQSHWRLITAVSFYIAISFILRWLGYRLERIRSRNLLGMWLAEIGSDIRIYGLGTALMALISYSASIYSTFWGWLAGIGRVCAKFLILLWTVLVVIAMIEVSVSYFSRVIELQEINRRDKKNMLTLIPVLGSAVKVVIYALTVLLSVAIFGVDVSPFLNMGAVFVGILGIAGSKTLEDIFNTLKVFIDRIYYVNSDIELFFDNASSARGVVSRITLFTTSLELPQRRNDGSPLVMVAQNHTIKRVIVYSQDEP